MNERREMAEIYGRGEMDLVNVGFREREYVHNTRVSDEIGVMRGNGMGLQSLSRSHDHGLSVRDCGASSRFHWDSLLDESRGCWRTKSVREDIQRSGFASRDQNHDGLVSVPNDVELRGGCPRSSGFASRGLDYDGIGERLLPLESERTKNVPTYDPNVIDSRGILRCNGVREDIQIRGFASRRQNYDLNVDGSEFRGEIRNVNGVPIENGRNYSVRERESPPRIEIELPRQAYDVEKNGLRYGPEDGSHILTPRSQSSGRRTPFQGIVNEGNYSVREREYPSTVEGKLFRPPYDEENGLKYHPEDGSHSLTPRSHSSGRHTPFHDIAMEGLPQEVQYHSVDGVGNGNRLRTSRSGSYHRVPHSNAGGNSHHFSTEAVNPRGEYAPSAQRPDDYVLPESRRSRIFYQETVPEYNYGNDHCVQAYNDQEGTIEINVANTTLPRRHHAGYSHRDVMVEDEYSGWRNISHTLHVAPTLDNSGGSRTAYEMVEANIDPRNSNPDHRTEDIRGSLPREEHISYGQDESGMMLYKGDYVNSARRKEVLLMDENTWQISETRDFTLREQPNITRKRTHEFVDQMHDSKRLNVSTRGVTSYENRHLRAEDERDFTLFNRITHHHDVPHSRAHVGMCNTETSQPFTGLRRSHEISLSESRESDRGDVKKRLTFPKAAVSRPCALQLPWNRETKTRTKPSPRNTHTTSNVKTYDKGKGTDVKTKLKPVPKSAVCPSAVPDPVVLDSGINIKKKQKLAIPESGNMNDALRSPDIDKGHRVLKVKPLVELPEHSEKFKQQVYKSFTDCIWHLYRNIGLKKRFMGNGTGGSLKCIICSSPTEFAETKDVATHAFSSVKVGYRALHLGFHQALCVLMGWDSAVAPDCRWVRRSLPELMVWTLKEDVIIWPPVVIIHNNPAKNYQNELGKETTELQNFLRDNGFIREIRSVQGNPGNLNVMVVKFNGTLPGYKEAERLHNFFAENRRGRVELAQIDAAEVVCCKLLFKTPKDELELVDKRENDQEPVDKTKDELTEHKTEDHLIDESKDVDEPLDKIKVDQQLVDMAQDDQTSVITAQDDQELIDTAQDEQDHVAETGDDQELIDTAQDEQDHVAKTADDQEPMDTAQDHVAKTEDDQEPVNKIEDDSLLVNKASDDQTPPDKIEPDQESVDKAENTLYGYLGIIEDLNILHQEITCHHLARSKIEIRAFL